MFSVLPLHELHQMVRCLVDGGPIRRTSLVLLLGNSITRGYHPKVEKLLEGKAYVGRLSGSKSVGDPALLDEWRPF